ncbi:MAG: class I SAM-dependent methyltransferase [Kofleriaceae bacterium]
MAGGRKQVPKAYRQVHTLAFAPLFFQAAMAARNMGVLAAVRAAKSDGITPSEVAARANVTLYAARVLLEGCLALQLVQLAEGSYSLTDAGYLWLTDEMTNVNANFVQDICYAGAAHFEDSLRTGTPAGLKVFGEWPTIYEGLTQLPAHVQNSWFAFDHFYSDSAFPLVFPRVFAPAPKRLLDVGGNTGKWAIHCLTTDPNVEVTVLDHPGQLAQLQRNAVEAGVASRLRTVPLNLLDHTKAFPTGFDVVWMSQFLDCFGEADILELLERGKAALGPNGRLCVMESFWDRQPNDVGELCVQGTSLYFTCMANGTSRMYHSQDFIELIAAAGLGLVTDEEIGTMHTLMTCVV